MKNLIFTVLLFLAALFSCKKEKKLNENLYNEIKNTDGYTYYKGNNALIKSSAQSVHGPYFRVRFNEKASSALTDSGKLPANGSFPEGSVIVKELYNEVTGNLDHYAVMKKSSSHKYSEKGWLWAEYEGDGNTKISVTKKGTECITCHSSNARDYVRLFHLFP